VCCARPITSLAPFRTFKQFFWWSKSRKKNVTVLEGGSFRTRLRSPSPSRRPHLTGKGSHDHGGVCPSFRQGKWYPSFKALRASTPQHWVRWDLRSSSVGYGHWRRIRRIFKDSPPVTIKFSYDLELFSTQFLTAVMRRSAIRALRGATSTKQTPKSVSRAFATVIDTRQRVHSSENRSVSTSTHTFLGYCRT
jgi:hypothetical protein